jgi:hypothetical protein
MNVMKWSVYDNSTDDVIGVWNKYEQAATFWLDHLSENGELNADWHLFPWMEVNCIINPF